MSLLPASVVRRGDYKLINFLDDGRKELYDLSKDLSEKHDLARKLPQKTAELETLLNRWLKETGAAEMALNPGYRKGRE